MLGAWCASTARAARGRAVCVTLLGASAWPCAERVGGGGCSHARARAPSGRGGACSHPRTHSTQQHTLLGGATCCPRSVWWQMCARPEGVAMMCLLVLASHGLGLCWMHTCTAVAALLWCCAAAHCTL